MKPHLSASSIGTYERCPEQFRWRYVEGIKSPPGVAAITGKGTHKSIEGNMLAKLAGGALDIEAAKALARDGVMQAWEAETPMLTDDDGSEEQARGSAVDDAVSLAALHHAEVAPSIQPMAVERRVEIALSGPFDLLGFIDIEEQKGVIDTKTSGKSPSADAAAKSTQLTIYDYARRMEGKESGFVRLDYLVKSKRPKYVPLVATRDEVDHDRMLARVARVAAAWQSGIFPFADPNSWACSQKFCGFWDRCEQGARQAVSVAVTSEAW